MTFLLNLTHTTWRARTSRLESISETKPIGRLMKKTHRQEKLWVIHPPSGGPTASYDRHAVEREGAAQLLLGKGIDQNRLLNRSETTTANSLEHAKHDQHGKAGRGAALKGSDGEQRNAHHVIALAPEHPAQPSSGGLPMKSHSPLYQLLIW
jgi:hypothetical protein